MGKFFKKTWYIFAILIVGFIVISYFDIIPFKFNIFKVGKVEMQDTPVLIKEVRNIGELVTAEYYGEIYADMFEAFRDIIPLLDSLDENEEIKLFAKYPHLEGYKKSRINYESKISDLEEYKRLLSEKEIQLIEEKDKVVYSEKEMENRKSERDGIKKWKERDLYSEANNKYKDARKIYNNSINAKKSVENEIKQAKAKRLSAERAMRKAESEFMNYKKKNNLVYIGRGWVKAGFDFAKIIDGLEEGSGDIKIDDSDSSTITINLPKPEILDSVINPWFIPSQKIMGYEIFIEAGSKFSNDEVTLVKVECVKKLVQVAIDKGLIKTATKSGVKTMEQFFQLLGFQKVIVKIDKEPVVIAEQVE